MNLIPNVIQRTSNGERAYDLMSRLLDDRIIMLTEEITDATASIVCAELLYLASKDDKADIQMYINSPGGSVTAGMAIYDTMQFIQNDVSTICMGIAASMGAFLLSSGTKGKRFCLPNAEVMIHQPLGGYQGQATDMMIHAQHMDRVKTNLISILAKNAGKDIDVMRTACERDNFLTAEEACKFGLVDTIITKK